jgi:hypothetical protein
MRIRRRITQMRHKQKEKVMSIKATSILRSAALLGTAVGAFAVLVPAASMAQAPRPDFPGAKQQEPYAAQTPDPAFSPRPDFPGPKEPNKPAGMTTTPQSNSKEGETQK